MQRTKTTTLLYHFFYPDDVVSARHFSDMAEELVKRNWDVIVLTSNRYCRYQKHRIPLKNEVWKGISVYRSYRPPWNQANKVLRLCNTLWMCISWCLYINRSKKTAYYIIGSDPQFSQILFPVLKYICPSSKIVYWCYDLYPEALVANSSTPLMKIISRLIKPIMRLCYNSADMIVDLGPCMQDRLKAYKHNAQIATLTPWALKEPSNIPEQNSETRQDLFSKVKLGLLYSGNLGVAHDFEIFLKLARSLVHIEPEIIFTFACRGNRLDEFKKALMDSDTNVRIASFCSEEELEKRLAAADLHMVSLRDDWEGVVVPSKFFGSLAVGKPVLYAGRAESDIGQWIQKYDCGLLLDQSNINEVAEQLIEYTKEDTKKNLTKWQKNAFEAYKQHFSKNRLWTSGINCFVDELGCFLQITFYRVGTQKDKDI
jgi:colanic acid biosynthesis glycosyl transferase WcaI